LKEPAEMREDGAAIDGAICGGAAMEEAGQTRIMRWWRGDGKTPAK